MRIAACCTRSLCAFWIRRGTPGLTLENSTRISTLPKAVICTISFWCADFKTSLLGLERLRTKGSQGETLTHEATYARCAFGASRIALTGLTSTLPTAAGGIRDAI